MLGWARLSVPVVALVLGACTPTPDEVTTDLQAASDTSAATTPTTTVTPSTTTAAATATDESADAPPSETDVGTTVGVADTTTAGDASSSGSSGPAPGCTGPEGCGSNEDCVDGRCVEACGGSWGAGSYGYCLSEYGAIATNDLCGPDHVCVYWDDAFEQIEQAACAFQGCVDACDCPPPAATGNATVTCGQLTAAETMTDCYLSCERGETCPDGMVCNDGGVCVTSVPEVPIYGDCGNLAPDCAFPGFCLDVMGDAVCTQGCTIAATDCPMAIPPGSNATVACSDIVPASLGFECYLECFGDLACPTGMICVNGTLCMWPD